MHEYQSIFSKAKKAVKPLYAYLAGYDVFLPNAIGIGEDKKALVRNKTGIVAQFPMDTSITDFGPNKLTACRIAKANEALMQRAQIIFVNMSLWPKDSNGKAVSPHMDGGTAFEAGYMSAKADFKPDEVLIVGYYEGPIELNYAKRIADMVFEGNVNNNNGHITDKNGITLENFDLPENLMIPGAIIKTGGNVFPSFDAAVDNVLFLWENKQRRQKGYQLLPIQNGLIQDTEALMQALSSEDNRVLANAVTIHI